MNVGLQFFKVCDYIYHMLTYTIAGIIFLTFLAQLAFPPLTEWLAFVPSLALSQPWRWITSLFVHANFTHLLVNLFVFLQFAPLVERKIGSQGLLEVFFLSGIAGNFFYFLSYLLGLIPDIPGVGASGAIAGLLGATMVFYPYLQLLLFFVIPMNIQMAFWLYVIWEFFNSFTMKYTGIGSAAHLGGALAGYLYAKNYQG